MRVHLSVCCAPQGIRRLMVSRVLHAQLGRTPHCQYVSHVMLAFMLPAQGRLHASCAHRVFTPQTKVHLSVRYVQQASSLLMEFHAFHAPVERTRSSQSACRAHQAYTPQMQASQYAPRVPHISSHSMEFHAHSVPMVHTVLATRAYHT